MESSAIKKQIAGQRRALRVRKNVRGTSARPRLCVVKTNKHIEAQLINDEAGITLAGVSTNSKELKTTPFRKKNKASAKVLGGRIAEKAKAIGIEKVVFDRGPFRYHGILAELAQSARDGGLQF
ncbi:MAG: 50S ribosomal protein L18 [Verrucomicrobia bacterium]|nr:50S ribosomal protein L18 [Verrucomicrobiota bacterium]